MEARKRNRKGCALCVYSLGADEVRLLPPGGFKRAVESGNAAVRPNECGTDAANVMSTGIRDGRPPHSLRYALGKLRFDPMLGEWRCARTQIECGTDTANNPETGMRGVIGA